MPWSVIAPDGFPRDPSGSAKVYDLLVTRPKTKGPGAYSQVLLVRHDHLTRAKEQIRLGAVMRVDVKHATPNWWAMGYYTGVLDPKIEPGFKEAILDGTMVAESARGFATRRFAVEHMLYRTGWWSRD